jgi:hypothetical protein
MTWFYRKLGSFYPAAFLTVNRPTVPAVTMSAEPDSRQAGQPPGRTSTL